jgi:hypothetical protein
MIEDDFFELTDAILEPLGSKIEPGDELREPPIDVLRYYVRPVRVSSVPFLGRGISVVAVCRQPIDIGFSSIGYRTLIERLASVVNTRFPPIKKGRGLTLGMTAIVTTPEPIGADEDPVLAKVLEPIPRNRAFPLGVFRINLGQEAVSFAIKRATDGLFSEPDLLADAYAAKLRRFVSLIQFE